MGRRRAVALAAASLAGLAGLAMAGAGLSTLAGAARSEGAYRALSAPAGPSPAPARQAGPEGPAPAAGDGGAPGGRLPCERDWGALRGENPSCAAWVRVAGTGVDLPVLACADEAQEAWCLSHDLWGAESPSGVPFMDHRCLADSAHVLAYGHHLAGIGGQFSDLHDAHDQQAFGSLGAALWETPAGGVELSPLCAARVAADDQQVQSFDLTGETFRQWVLALAGSASARAEGWEAMAATAGRCLTLATCSSDVSGQPWRTIVTFCDGRCD